ncbi:type II toxin-antitoxin system RelE/ParE family toxin [uncultured Gimesia sp.]|uniref:type II toxin-antitoxin system RelE/ParE family toxin n=1 Tax=uncultured Gimesia sp. TaxID=1678688 RepID=UPI00261EC2C5|nr:type II toxin-antitoxin system RelE/ParE family toxin [uncultured Gimesia sp.]
MTTLLKISHTLIARAKLKEIYAYSCDHWGEKVAQKYMDDLEAAIQQAAREQGGTKSNPDFSTRFTYSPARKHYLFFEIRDDTLFLATIFHAVMNIKERLAEEMDEIKRELEETTDE